MLSDSASLTEGVLTTPPQSHLSSKHPSQPPTAQEPVSLDQLVKRLQEHVLCNRIRVSEHFQDFDPLRSGSISTAKFRQVRQCVPCIAYFKQWTTWFDFRLIRLTSNKRVEFYLGSNLIFNTRQSFPLYYVIFLYMCSV